MRSKQLRSHLAFRSAAAQGGQALLEGLVIMLGLLTLWTAISWIGKLQDIALQADHASRHAAFSLTRQSVDGLQEYRLLSPYIYAPEHRWSDSTGQALQANEYFHAEWTVDRDLHLPAHGQVGGDQYQSIQLRRDWRLQDEGIYRSKVAVIPDSRGVDKKSTAWWTFGLPYPVVTRSTSILAGAGHGADDGDAQTVMGRSDLAWRRNAAHSHRISDSIADVMNAVDHGWQRAAPATDWLEPWTDIVPGSRGQASSPAAFGVSP